MDTQRILSGFEPHMDNMINILHALQNNNPQNYLTSDDLKSVATYLNTTYSSVYGVVTYYSMFSLQPRGKYVIRVCSSPVCHMVDGKKLMNEIKQQLGIGLGETTQDLVFSFESAECLGHCAESPVMMVNGKVYKELDSFKIRNIFQSIRLNEQNNEK